MAVKYITATTLPLLWSVSTNWNNSSLPTSVDDVYTSGKIITINQDITVQTITNAALTSPALTGGGTFSPSGGSWTLNTNISGGSTGSLSCLTISALTLSQTLTISGNTVAGTLAGINGITKTSGGTLNIIGNITGGSTTAYGLNNNFTQPVNITGNSYTLTTGAAIHNPSTGTISMIGNVYNYGTSTGGNGAVNSGGTFNLTGDVINLPTTASLVGIANGTGTTNVTGTVYGGLNNLGTCYGINNTTTTGRINVVGTVIGGNSTGYGIFNNTTGIVSVTGNVTSYGTIALYNNSTGTINVTSPNGIVQSTPSTVPLIQNNAASPATINIIGNISGSTSDSPSKGYVIFNNTTGIINITGNTVVRDVGIASNAGLIYQQNTGAGTINIVGDVRGGSVPNSISIWLNGAGVVNISGNCYGGSNLNVSPAISSNVSGNSIRINITGSCVAGTSFPAIYTLGSGNIHVINGSLVYTNGLSPILATSNRIQVIPTSTTPLQSVIMTDTNNNNRYFLTTNTGNTAPLSGNVRSDIIYSGFSPTTIQYTGSCSVPDSSLVTLGVPVGSGYGTASGMTINNLSAMISSYVQ
jgi:hypothetical protein